LTAEFNKITTCDTEVVCAGNSGSFGGGESGTIGVQEAAAVADHEGAIVDLALASSGGDETATSVQEAASVADPESMDMHDHEGDDGAPGIVLQCNSFHPTNLLLPPPSFLPVHIHRVGYSSAFPNCYMLHCLCGCKYSYVCLCSFCFQVLKLIVQSNKQMRF
jgi:hypothetical protein